MDVIDSQTSALRNDVLKCIQVGHALRERVLQDVHQLLLAKMRRVVHPQVEQRHGGCPCESRRAVDEDSQVLV